MPEPTAPPAGQLSRPDGLDAGEGPSGAERTAEPEVAVAAPPGPEPGGERAEPQPTGDVPDTPAAGEPESSEPASTESADLAEPEERQTAGADAGQPVERDAGPVAEAAAGESVATRARSIDRRVLVVAGLTVLLLVLWGVGGWLFVRDRAAREQAEQRAAALDVAQRVATDLTSIDGQNAADRVRSLTDESTGELREQVGAYATAVEAILRQAQAGSRGTVSAAGLQRIDATSASALVAVSGLVTNPQAPAGQPVAYRLDVELQRQGDRWLAENVRFLP